MHDGKEKRKFGTIKDPKTRKNLQKNRIVRYEKERIHKNYFRTDKLFKNIK